MPYLTSTTKIRRVSLWVTGYSPVNKCQPRAAGMLSSETITWVKKKKSLC